MIRVVLCDDHAMVRRGIKDTLADAGDIEVVGESGSYSEVRDVIRKIPCDVLLLDLNLPGRGGLEVLASLREGHSEIKVLIVSMFAEDQYALRCLRAAELIPAVRALASGRKYVTPEISQMLVANLSTPSTQALHSTLSERELQTLLKIASGKRLSDIAEDLMLSPKTVSVYRARLLDKLKLANNAELTVYAIRNNLV